MTHLHLFTKYLREQKRYSERTVAIYTQAITSFFRFAGAEEEKACANMPPSMVRAYMAKMMEEEFSPRTVQLHLSAISSFYRFLSRQGLSSSNPATGLPRPKASKPLPDFYAQSALNHLLDSPIDSSYSMQFQAHVVIHTLYATGIRRAELTGLKVSDVDFLRKLMRVRGKGNKTREVPLTDALVRDLRLFMEGRKSQVDEQELHVDAPLFVTTKGNKLPLSYVNKMVHAVLDGAQGIPGRKTPHRLRHSLATHLLHNGADVFSIKEVLGHSSLAATQIYTHSDFKTLQKVHKQFHPRSE
ncbi:MAG: tyrosine-type recombinase/integrase [Bacteroidetes bacterium]|nr:tyrosine-type recombinase/integrase [Bacteroidota bacterium]